MPVQSGAMSAGDALRRIGRGDPDAIQAILDEFGQPLLNYLYRMLGDSWAADDLLQETMVKLIRNAGEIRDEASLKTWLYSVAHNLAVAHLRRKGVERRNRPEAPDGPARPEESLDRTERIEAVQKAVDQIDEPFKTAFILCEMQGLDHESASKIMGCSLKTVSSRLYRAWDRFRALMKPYLLGHGK